MLSIPLDPQDPRSLVDQLVEAIRHLIDQRTLPPGSRLPSIRRLAEAQGISRFTVVEAYDRLVALGCLEARRGAGFFTAGLRDGVASLPTPQPLERNSERVLLVRRFLDAPPGAALAGGPWLPNDWMDEKSIRQGLSALARRPGPHLLDYGHPLGYLPLREHLVLLLAELGIAARATQVVLTQGSSQAFDLVARRFLRPGDSVLVEDPGYYNLFANLRLQGARLLAVPRTAEGPDLAALEQLAMEHRPRLFFIQPALQNPTGTDMSPHVCFRVLQLAEQFDFMVVEDDIFWDFQARKTPRLAALDRFNRVIYTRSFSKTFSGSLRVGFLAARQEIADELADVKMLSSISSSLFAERLLYGLLLDGHYRKFVARLQKRLGEARLAAIQLCRRLGLQIFVEPEAGMFLWVRLPGVEDSLQLSEEASGQGIVLAPGTVFRPHLEPSPWMRLNVTSLEDPRVGRWLERAVAPAANRAA